MLKALLGLILAAHAAPPSAFTLSCDAEAVIGPDEGRTRLETYVVDLRRRTWCQNECAIGLKIHRIDGDRVWLLDTDLGDGRQAVMVDVRLGGSLSAGFEPDGTPRYSWMGKCVISRGGVVGPPLE